MAAVALAVGGDSRRPAGRRHHHPGHRRVAHGQTPRHHPQAAGGGDAGQHDGHLLRQDRHAHREPDDGADAVEAGGQSVGPCSGGGLCARPAKSGARHPACARPSRDACAPACCATMRLWSRREGRWDVARRPDRGRAAGRRRARAARSLRAEQAAPAASRRDPVRVPAPVHGHAARRRRWARVVYVKGAVEKRPGALHDGAGRVGRLRTRWTQPPSTRSVERAGRRAACACWRSRARELPAGRRPRCGTATWPPDSPFSACRA